jgi:hypothetical protein
MDKVTFIKIETMGVTDTHAIIEHEDGSFTSMLKSTYEAMQAEQSTPNLAVDEAKTK